jgi:hypothetical protein
MTVKKKAIKPKYIQADVDDVINRGGKVSTDSKQTTEESDEEIRFTLRISHKLIKKIDKDRQTRIGNVSRNQWILEAVAEKLN